MPCSDLRRAVSRPATLLLGLSVCLLSAPRSHAGEEVAGPIEIGPSWGSANAADATATLTTSLQNQGDLADRLIRAECPAAGTLALLNGTLHRQVMAPNQAQAEAGAQRNGEQNGLDVPPSVDGRAPIIQARFSLSNAHQPMPDGTHVPCALSFAHAGERVVVFTLGARPPATQEP